MARIIYPLELIYEIMHYVHMTHSKTPFKIKTIGLASVLAATALGACANTSEKPTFEEASVTTDTTTTVTNDMATPGAMSASSGTLVLDVTGYAKQSGQIMVALYNSEDAFDSEGAPFRGAQVAVNSAQTAITFDNLPVGDYAFKVFHDVNGNGALDTNAFGMPTEKYAFSKDASDPFSAPEWEESKIYLPLGENIRNVFLD